MKKYLIIIEKTSTGYSAYIPDLPGCVATGNTKDDVENNIYEAIIFHLEGLEAEGIQIPEAKSESEIMVIQYSRQTGSGVFTKRKIDEVEA